MSLLKRRLETNKVTSKKPNKNTTIIYLNTGCVKGKGKLLYWSSFQLEILQIWLN